LFDDYLREKECEQKECERGHLGLIEHGYEEEEEQIPEELNNRLLH
jgi:hypothetical protein